jgi:inositol phosphorylceramide mannosyltransferase catalytic subunit
MMKPITIPRQFVVLLCIIVAGLVINVWYLTIYYIANFDERNNQVKSLRRSQNPMREMVKRSRTANLSSSNRTGLQASNKTGGHIPHIIHQSWKVDEIPNTFQKWSDEWRRQHPDWTYMLWTDDENMLLVRKHFPWIFEMFENLPHNIQRADIARCMYLYLYGGVYSDLDSEPLRPMDELLEITKDKGHELHAKVTAADWHESVLDMKQTFVKDLENNQPGRLLLGWMSTDYGFAHNLPNAWMASEPGHYFWIFMLNKIMRTNPNKDTIPEEIGGPVMLYDAVREYVSTIPSSHRDGITLLAPGVVFPYDWRTYSHAGIKIKEAFKPFRELHSPTVTPAFAITYWTHSWDSS